MIPTRHGLLFLLGLWISIAGVPPSLDAAALEFEDLIGADIGEPAPAGSTTREGGAVILTAGGAGIGPRFDQFHFASTELTNDFDIKIRVAALDATSLLARAGLMVRESQDSNAPFVGVFASPSAAGTHLLHRASPGSTTVQTGTYPPNLPDGWLRLRRAGDQFTGYASADGVQWSALGTVSVSFTQPQAGLAATSQDTNRTVRAEFRDLADAGPGDLVVPLAFPVEPPGPTSRRAAVIVSEIMYHPVERADGRVGEFVEIYNSQPFFEDLSGWKLTGDYEFTFPTNTIIPGGGFLLVAPEPADIQAIHGLEAVMGGFTNRLSNGGGILQLRNELGAVYFEVEWKDKPPWPLAADGGGHSLALIRPSFGESDSRAWGSSRNAGGSPGAWESFDASPMRQIRINELLTRGDGSGQEPFVELFNPARVSVDLSGCQLGYSPPSAGYFLPEGTRIGPGAHLAISEAQLGFALRADAETLFLRAPAEGLQANVVLDAVRFDPADRGISRGRFPDGTDEAYALTAPTPGSANGRPQPAPVVINELFHSPLSGDDDLQFLELHNPGASGISLAGWRLEDGIRFVFPAGAFLPAGGYLVVARDAGRLRAARAELTSGNCLGNFSGRLSGRGERVVLERPEVIPGVGGQPARTVFIPVDEVSYRTGGRWGFWSDGGGSSLELTDPRADRRMGIHWADSDESALGKWVTLETTGVLELGGTPADSLHVGLMGEGECLLDNLEVIGPGGTNLIANGTFEAAAITTFNALGNHIRSSFETSEGDASPRSLHIRASGNMDTGANRIRFRLLRNLQPGDTATLRARVRWLKGWPEPLLRLHGNWLEAIGRLDTPEVGGTPAAPNSRRVANAAPALDNVAHTPVLPAAGEPVVVTVRANDPDGIASVLLNWRLDPSAEVTATPMRDDGADGDLRAGDGVYSATIPGQATNALVAFTLTATDAAATPAARHYPEAVPSYECLVRFGDTAVANAFGTYRLWLTRSNASRWSGRPNLSNEPVPGTLVYGNFRAIHGAGYRFSGSPYHQQFASPTNDCHYVWRLPGDDRLLGSDNFNKIHAPGNGPFDDETIQREQTVYWMARQLGLPWLYRRYVNVVVNGSKRRRLMEDTQVPGGDFVESYHPEDDTGDLYKINPWFEFDAGTGASIGFNNVAWAELNDYRTSDGSRKVTRYRWNWQPRAAQGTVNNYTNFFALLDAANTPDEAAFVRGLEREADMDQWLRTFALNHAVGNWDSFGHQNAQNMYTYRPTLGRFELYMWDANIVLGHSIANGPNESDLFWYNGTDIVMGRIYANPGFRRSYLRWVQRIADGPMQPGPVGALMDAKYAAFQAAGTGGSSPSTIKSWIRSRVTTLRNLIRNELGGGTVSFTAQADGVSGGTTDSNVVVLTGTAPLGIHSIRINDVAHPVTWISVTEWRVIVSLQPGNNRLNIAGLGVDGAVVPGALRQVNVRFTGQLERPEDRLVFSEIQYRPLRPGAEYVELLNASASHTFDVSGWRLDGLGYTFPPGTLLAPGARWVVAANNAAFLSAYPWTFLPPQDVFTGTLSPAGETLRLIRPGAPPEPEAVVTAVTYSPEAPWPGAAAGSGVSLQLVDPGRSEDERAGNWSAVPPRDPNAIEWQFATATGTAGDDGTLQLYLSSFPPVTDPADVAGLFWGSIAFGGEPFPCGIRVSRSGGSLSVQFLFDLNDPANSAPMTGVSWDGTTLRFGFDAANRFSGRLDSSASRVTGTYTSDSLRAPFAFERINPGGEIFVDDIVLLAGSGVDAGPNLLANAGFEEPLDGTWTASGGHSASERITDRAHTGSASLRVHSETGGNGSNDNAVLQSVAGLTPGATMTLGYWYLGTPNGSGFMVRLGSNGVAAAVTVAPPPDPHLEATPGGPNATDASLAPFPDLWINEVLPDPISGEPFAELFNHGTHTALLDGLYLGDRVEDPLRDALPAGIAIPPGGFLRIVLDGSGRLDDPAGPRTSFRPAVANGLLTLSRRDEERVVLVDFLRWRSPGHGRSYGHYPDASPHDDREFATPTPGAPNSLAVPPAAVVINEWMALNTRIADPAGGPASDEFDDWFELYNPNTQSVNLDGYVLSNRVDDRTKFRIPPGYSISGRGFLLVWADNQSRQNQAGGPHLHVNFRLSGDGEAIALFAPDGSLVDAVTFGPQQQNVSEGRASDGGSGAFVRFSSPSPGSSNVVLPTPATPLLFVPTVRADGAIELQWRTESGRRYQVRWKESLSDPWQPLGSPMDAGGTGLSAVDAQPGITARFYDVLVVE